MIAMLNITHTENILDLATGKLLHKTNMNQVVRFLLFRFHV